MTKDRGFLIFVLDVNSSPDMGMLKASGFRLGRERGVVWPALIIKHKGCILLSGVPSSHRLSLALQVSIGSYVMQISELGESNSELEAITFWVVSLGCSFYPWC